MPWSRLRLAEAGGRARRSTVARLAAALSLPTEVLTASPSVLVETGLGLPAECYAQRLPRYGWRSRWEGVREPRP